MTGLSERAAGAQTIFAPAALCAAHIRTFSGPGKDEEEALLRLPRKALDDTSDLVVDTAGEGAATTGGSGLAPLSVAFAGVFYPARFSERRHGVYIE